MVNLVDQAAIERAAENLSALLDRYASESSEVQQLRRELLPFMERARDASIRSPLSWADIPGAYLFTEGTLGKYRDLEDALAKFKLQVTGIGDRATEIMRGIPRLGS